MAHLDCQYWQLGPQIASLWGQDPCRHAARRIRRATGRVVIGLILSRTNHHQRHPDRLSTGSQNRHRRCLRWCMARKAFQRVIMTAAAGRAFRWS